MGQSQSVPKLSKVSSCQWASSLDSSVSSSAKRSCKVDGLPISFPDDLTNCKKGEVKVKSLGIYMEPLQSKLSSGLSATPFTHHFLIIDVDCVEMPNGDEEKPGFIRAEKGQAENCGQITVNCLRRFGALKPKEKRVCKLADCGTIPMQKVPDILPEEKRVCKLADCGTIPMQKVLDILEEPNSDYCFLSENCWKYADQTFRRLIQEFSDLAEPGSETKKRLQSYLENLPVPRMPGDAFSWSFAEAYNCSLPPAVGAYTYLSTIACLSGAAAWTASKASLAVLPVLGLGSASPLAGPVALQVSSNLPLQQP